MLPRFICPGAQKSATTSIYYILKQHPEIYTPETKEIHFFDRNHRFHKGIDYYRSFFRDDDLKIAGDFTPDYMFVKMSPNGFINRSDQI